MLQSIKEAKLLIEAWFGRASPSGQGRAIGRATLMMETGCIHWGRSEVGGRSHDFAGTNAGL